MRFAALFAVGLAVMTGLIRAQSSDDDDDEIDYFPLNPSGNFLHFGTRILGGPKVAFGKLGNISTLRDFGDATGAAIRYYEDGTVSTNARYDSNGAVINDGFTNSWNFANQSQITPAGYVVFHAYSASTLGGSTMAKKNLSTGWELQMGKNLFRVGRKATLAVVAGFNFTDINATSMGEIPVQLDVLNDAYSLSGQTPPDAPYGAPSQKVIPIMDVNGNPALNNDGSPQTQSVDTTVLLPDHPTTRTTTQDTSTVKGRWQIKGAYYTFRVGPSLRLQLSERFKVNLGAGVAVAYIGSRYEVQEELELDALTQPAITTEESSRNVVLPAFYADLDAEYWLTDRTGFYLGASLQKSGSYNQTLGDRTAKIDMGTASGIQTGLSLRF
jgi:hypothetical protein